MKKSDNPFITSTTTSTGTPSITSQSSTTANVSGVKITTQVYMGAKRMADIEKAVYAHIQAVRTLGRDQINTDEIAQALDIPAAYVLAALEKLRTKGVRLVG